MNCSLGRPHPAGLMLVMAAALVLSGCLPKKYPVAPNPSPVPPPGTGVADKFAVGPVPSSIGQPWRQTAARLAGRGFSSPQIEAVFNSPNTQYTSAPMATKLKELYGIYFRSDLTKEIQQMLYQLGYDLIIDGRAGSGTAGTIKRFQADNKLPQTGEISQGTKTALAKAMKGRRLRPLSGYKPPPSEKPSRSATYPQFTNASALAEIEAHYKGDLATFRAMSRRYNVPGEVAAAIMWVETGYGTFMGKNKAVNQLASMSAAAMDFSVVEGAVADLARDAESRTFLKEKAVERGEWALDELTALLRYAFDNGCDPSTFPGSIYGAVGWGQFMPSNVLKFAVDGNGNGQVDIFDKTDAIFSIGNYFKAHGWHGGTMSEDERRAVVLKYNKSGVYVNTVLYVADYLAKVK